MSAQLETQARPARQQNRGAGHGGDAFAAADEAQPFHGRRLDADASRIDAEYGGDGLAHGAAVRADLRRLAQERHVDVGDAPAQFAHARGRIGEKDARGGAAPGRVARREVLADVAVADGAEQRVGECMQPDVGVGVPFEAMRVRDLHAAQPDVIAGGEAMHVEAGAVARLAYLGGAGRQQPFGERDVGGRRQLDVARAAGHELHRQARPIRRARRRR